MWSLTFAEASYLGKTKLKSKPITAVMIISSSLDDNTALITHYAHPFYLSFT